MKEILKEFWMFGIKQAYACIFAGVFLFVVVVSHFYYPIIGLHRYDFLFLAAVVIQLLLLVAKLEKIDEFYAIILFHILATGMELYKTHMGSWSYPDPSDIRLAGVPLFAGFMYSAVGSYIARIWRIFKFEFTDFPFRMSIVLISICVYLNFFTHHYVFDVRYVLLLAIIVAMRKTQVCFTISKIQRKMPLLLGLFLVSVFIWFAENISTYCRVWYYPSQAHGWTMVSPSKLLAWFLLMFISFSIIYILNSKKTPN